MAILRTDPSQGKTVAALLAVLALAVGVTVYRVQSTQSVRAGVIQVPVAAETAEVNTQIGVVGRPYRNPFKKPAVLQTDTQTTGTGNAAVPSPTGISTGVPLPSVRQGLEPMLVAPLSDTPGDAQNPQTAVQTTDLPTFVLMATVLTSGKSSAVLRIGDSQIKVVRVGDMADARFRLCSLKSDQAVLSDGTIKLMAKRGRIEDEKPTGL